MKDYLLKVKTKQTLYLDFEDNEWSEENPSNWSCNSYYKNNIDYKTLRKGSVLFVKYYDSEYDSRVYVYSNSCMNGIIFESVEQLIGWNWFEILEDRRCI